MVKRIEKSQFRYKKGVTCIGEGYSGEIAQSDSVGEDILSNIRAKEDASTWRGVAMRKCGAATFEAKWRPEWLHHYGGWSHLGRALGRDSSAPELFKMAFIVPFSTVENGLWEKGKSGNGGLERNGALVLLVFGFQALG